MKQSDHELTDEEKDKKKAELRVFPHPKSHIKQIIGITSGKGGVGKSTITSLLASHANKQNVRVGIIDADVSGPSIPQAFGLHSRLTGNDEGLIPEETSSGIKIVSVNLMLDQETNPLIWRGPLISNLIKKFYTDVIWGDIDVLFVDFPPGTSDVAITMFQSIPINGVVVITSPQDLVSMIVSKAIHMAEKMNVAVFGLIENMSYFECPKCHTKHEIFGHSKIQEVANEHNIPLLAKLPIKPLVSSLYDEGRIEELKLDAIDEIIGALFNDQPINKE
ncbi:MAG: P-loop NTPase [Bacilli bacterium]